MIKSKPNTVKCKWTKGCGIVYNIWENTIFYKTKIKKTIILRVIELWLNKVNGSSIAFVLRIDKKTVYRIMKKLSTHLVPNYYDNIQSIGGRSTIVEIDESKFGKRKYHRGHTLEGVWVLGMVERTNQRRIILIAVDNRTKTTLEEKIKKHVSEESQLYTDCWKGYTGLSNLNFGHQNVNHSETFVNPEDNTHTNTIEGNWAAIKMQTPIRGRKKTKVNLFLVRYMLLRNEEGNFMLNILKYLF